MTYIGSVKELGIQNDKYYCRFTLVDDAGVMPTQVLDKSFPLSEGMNDKIEEQLQNDINYFVELYNLGLL